MTKDYNLGEGRYRLKSQNQLTSFRERVQIYENKDKTRAWKRTVGN